MRKTEMKKYEQQLFDLARNLIGKDVNLKKEALRSLAGDTRANLSKVPVHLGDLSSDCYEQEVSASLLENEREMLQEIAVAIERIDAGTFGKCENCQEPISEERLHAVPYTRYCIDCARELEQSGQA
jgi:RNA polymerase-binding transcription factor DksA